MSILQSNVDYLANKVDSKDIDKIPDEDSFKYDQDIVANQGTTISIIFYLHFTQFGHTFTSHPSVNVHDSFHFGHFM